MPPSFTYISISNLSRKVNKLPLLHEIQASICSWNWFSEIGKTLTLKAGVYLADEFRLKCRYNYG
jgi:hypothetical protein